MTYVLELSSVKLFHRKRVFMGIILSILITAVRLIWGKLWQRSCTLLSLSLFTQTWKLQNRAVRIIILVWSKLAKPWCQTSKSIELFKIQDHELNNLSQGYLTEKFTRANTVLFRLQCFCPQDKHGSFFLKKNLSYRRAVLWNALTPTSSKPLPQLLFDLFLIFNVPLLV